MSNSIKLPFYILLTIAVCVFGLLFGRNYNQLGTATPPSTSTNSVEAATGETLAIGASTGPASRTGTYLMLFITSALLLGLLVASDVSNYFGNRSLKVLYNDEGEGMQNPEYDQAEQVWADGNHLEAIRLMREYLLKNPREQHVAIRIAEIYEKDLRNYLAAALEYEDVLQHNLPRERWGWAAIHLCNLYFRLNQTEKAVTLLRRIDAEYGETQAAEKARKRLTLYESESESGNTSLIEGAPAPDNESTS
ncbi:MAG: hypothetical protein EXS31_13400 [Pedosphaera sp.]|nr:hypothetical protein [Pedosphaera sp.]